MGVYVQSLDIQAANTDIASRHMEPGVQLEYLRENYSFHVHFNRTIMIRKMLWSVIYNYTLSSILINSQQK